jgi:hypothetical protein
MKTLTILSLVLSLNSAAVFAGSCDNGDETVSAPTQTTDASQPAPDTSKKADLQHGE